MKDNDSIIYRLLLDVFTNKAYSGIKLNEALLAVDDASDRAYITKIFYGVIEKSVQFDYIIALLSPKKPKNNIIVLLKMGLYLLRYTSSPDYASISKTVALAKELGKTGASGFINAILRKSTQIDLNSQDYQSAAQRLSVCYSYPLWMVQMLTKQYGTTEAEAFLSYQKRESTHIRHNPSQITKQDFQKNLENICSKKQLKLEQTALGYYVSHALMKSIPASSFTAQSYSSMLATHSYLNKDEADLYKISDVLDVCGAPGGKSVYLKQLFPQLKITCCDLHPHRVKLISDYATRMGVELTAKTNDATKLRDSWQSAFDLVICDVPCSGLGLVNSKPDIILNRTTEDITALAALQSQILKTSANYVKKGGFLCYSTCTVLKQENEDITNNFLKQNPDFRLLPIDNEIQHSAGYLKLLPQKHDTDGFFIAKMQRK